MRSVFVFCAALASRMLGRTLTVTRVERRIPSKSEALYCVPVTGFASNVNAPSDAGVAVVATSDRDALQAVLDAPPRVVLDLHGSGSPNLEALPGYSGIAW